MGQQRRPVDGRAYPAHFDRERPRRRVAAGLEYGHFAGEARAWSDLARYLGVDDLRPAPWSSHSPTVVISSADNLVVKFSACLSGAASASRTSLKLLVPEGALSPIASSAAVRFGK